MKNLKKINWKRMLLDNWVLKLASLTVAFILWYVVIIEEDPVEDKTFYGIKVNLINTEKLVELGRVYEVLDGTDTLRSVTVEAPGSVLDKLSEGDIIAQADLNNISGMNTVEIQFSCPGYTRDIIDISGNISNVKLSIEDKASKSVDIKYNMIGEVAEGHMISNSGGITLAHTRLSVEGPKSKVDQIAKAIVDVDVSGATTDFATPLPVYLIDKEGNTLSFDSVEQSVKTVNVNAAVLKIVEKPIVYNVTGEVAEGYLQTGVVESSLSSVKIAGSPKTLNRMPDVIVFDEELNITGATETMTIEVDLRNKLSTGIIFEDEEFDGKATVTIYIEEEAEKNLTLRRENQQIQNVPEGIIAEVVIEQDMPALQVKGLAADIASLRESTLTGIIDVAEWLEQHPTESLTGIYSLPVSFALGEGQNAVNHVSVQVQFVEVETEIDEAAQE
ncbi:MAG: hypothetical protein IJ326_11355 [Lachnospiraceae bacterium]|nr:hypothetical protein [Lachnospiraceae bacterium]